MPVTLQLSDMPIDSIHTDSIEIISTLKESSVLTTEIAGFSKEDGILRNDTFRNENWVFATVLVLFLFLIFAVNRSYGWIIESITNFTRVKTRSSLFSSSTQSEYKARHLLTLFTISVVSLTAYVLIRPFEYKIFISTYSLLFASFFVFVILKNLIFNFLAYTFFDKELFRLAKDQYYFLFALLGITLFPIILVRIYLPEINHHNIIYLALIIASVYPLVLFIKLMQIFSGKFLELFYILLYLCTLEIIPLAFLFRLYNFILKI